MTLLVADVEELTADAIGPAEGIVIEGHMEKGRGAVVSLLVEQGQLKQGDFVSAGTARGKVRTLSDINGKPLALAGPSTPVVISGLKELPDFGAIFNTHVSDKEAKSTAEKGQAAAQSASVATTSGELLAQIHKDRMAEELPVIIKADVRGSMTSVVEALQKLKNEQVSVRVVTSGVGPIGESDVMTASASKAVIYGFSVDAPAAIRRLAAKEGVSIRLYKVIYELIDDATTELELRMPPEIVETSVGRLIIKGVFKTSRHEIICGGEVSKGKAVTGSLARIERGEEVLGEVEVVTVQKAQEVVDQVPAGEMCGLRLKTQAKINLKEEDRLELFTREEVARKLR
jgi:translation initiation factor IF-2